MSKCIRPKIFHFTKDYDISPVHIKKEIPNRLNFTLGHFLKNDDQCSTERTRKMFEIRTIKTKSAVCEVRETENYQKRRKLTFKLVSNFVIRRKSAGKRFRLNSAEINEDSVYQVVGESFERKKEEIQIEYFNELPKEKKWRAKRRNEFESVSNERKNTISIQADISIV